MRIEARADERTRQLMAVLSIAADEGAPPLVAGQVGRATVDGRVVRGVRLPRHARRDDGTVWLLDDDNRLQRRPVTAILTGGDSIVIPLDGGLGGGERICLTHSDTFHQGMAVRPTGPATTGRMR